MEKKIFGLCFLVDFVIEFGNKQNVVFCVRQKEYSVHLALCKTGMEL